ncbi:MAG: hypothetical protein A2Y10_06095 [Planctomycetes bacterium GWF2_41_51]|nr:MAG: hypothetical protein A2Y10_06095 [Planctomycetes bacterium GWF2_41_51]
MKPILFVLIVVGLALSVSEGTISLIPDNNNPDPNEEVTVYVQTDTPLFAMGIGIYVLGDANITTAMSEADCNQYGWDNGWNSDPYIDPNGYIYLGGVRWASDANGTIGYFKFRFNRWQTRIYIDQENSIAFGWDGENPSFNVPFSNDVLLFGEPDPNEPNEPNEPNVPPHYWQNKLEEIMSHLIQCPDSNSDIGFGKPEIEERLDKDRGEEEMLLDSESTVIEIYSDITTNQIWTANNVYWITSPIQVQALLVIEPGTTVMFGDDYGYYDCAIYVNNGGTLISKGTPNNPIIYTCDFMYPDWGYYYEYLEYYGNYYFCPIYIEHTACPATTVTYNFIEGAVVGIVTENIMLDNPIENNHLFGNLYGIGEFGTSLTDIRNNLCYYNYYSGIEVYFSDVNDIGDANSIISIENNTCDYTLYDGITVHGVADGNDSGVVFLENNIVAESQEYGLNLVDGAMYAMVSNTGYYDNGANKNWSFDEDNPIEATSYPFDEYGWHLVNGCQFIDAGSKYIEQTSLIGTTTDVNNIPDCNTIDIGYHYSNWNYSNANTGFAESDFNKDVITDFEDLYTLVANWLNSVDPNTNGDLTNDGTVNFKDITKFAANWQKIQGEPNLTPTISGDPNTGYVHVNIDNYPSYIRQVSVFDNGQYIGNLYGFADEALAMNVSGSANQEHEIKLISITDSGQTTCSHITNVSYSCHLNCYIPNGYESGKPFSFAGFNSGMGNISVELLGDGGFTVWSDTYSGSSFTVVIPAAITSQYDLDCITLSTSPGVSPIERPVFPRLRPKEVIPGTEALIILPDLSAALSASGSIYQVERAFKQIGIKYTRLGFIYASSPNIAAFGWTCPIRYIYFLGHGGYQYNENGGVVRTRVKLVDGISVSVKESDFDLGGYPPSWCEPLEPRLEHSLVWSWATMGFQWLELAYFDGCYTGRLKINTNNQLVVGQPGQIGVFDGPHSDMSYALGMASTNRDCVYHGWYDKATVSFWTSTDFNKWTQDVWSKLSIGVLGGDIYTAIQYAISRQTSFVDPKAPVNTYRLKGHGLITEVGLHDD